jgi:hypothetical protein
LRCKFHHFSLDDIPKHIGQALLTDEELGS